MIKVKMCHFYSKNSCFQIKNLLPCIEFKDGVTNNGEVKVYPNDFANRDNGDDKRKYTFGFIQMNLTIPDPLIQVSPSVTNQIIQIINFDD